MGLDEGVVDSDDLDLGVGNTMGMVRRGSWIGDLFHEQLTHCGRPERQLADEPMEPADGATYNAANTTETVDTNLDNHDCGLLDSRLDGRWEMGGG